jgi:soluble lytic murein transglycosylase-like protein
VKIKIALLLSIAFLTPNAAHADDDDSVTGSLSSNVKSGVPHQLGEREIRDYSNIFSAIKSQQWSQAENLLNAQGDDALSAIARALIYLDPASPRVELAPLVNLLNKAPYIPQAEQLAALAKKRGADVLPSTPQRRELSYIRGLDYRGRPGAVTSDANANGLRGQINGFIKQDNPAAAEQLVLSNLNSLTAEARTELLQRTAWSYYIENDDRSALRVAKQAVDGVGEWRADSHWVAGLASWRLGDSAAAARHFQDAAASFGNSEMRTAGMYWAARAYTAAGQPEKVQSLLQTAAQYDETFYGILAAEALGIENIARKSNANFVNKDWRSIAKNDNVKAAIGLAQIGELELADEVLRYQAAIGGDADHAALIALASALDLPRTQIWLAHNGPRGFRPDSKLRFPAPKWTPDGGWRVNPSLVFAHTLQESGFRNTVVSSAGAVGLMQVLPGTANDIARKRGGTATRESLVTPSTNLEYGQSYLEMLSTLGSTNGYLPKIIAAYNAGPTPIARWNSEIRDNNDPLLYMESIPYGETRGYVTTIMRNFWIYEQQGEQRSDTLRDMAQHKWARFPQAGKNNKWASAGR